MKNNKLWRLLFSLASDRGNLGLTTAAKNNKLWRLLFFA
nr:MAG TPA: hypothetical protein [Caudoviricetes sp.]